MVSKDLNKAIKQNFPLAELNTFGVDTFAENVLVLENVADLTEVLEAFDATEIRILGGGSNILMTQPISGLLIWNQLKGKKVLKETDEAVWLEIAAGENWHELVLWTLEQGYYGLENLSLIPGTVGAAPIQNIGAYGVEICEFIQQVDAYELATGALRRFFRADCKFGYRDSIFKRAYKGKLIITSIRLELSKVPKVNTSYGAIQQQLEVNSIASPTPKDVSDAVIAIRQSKLPDPSKIGNCGSFFKNPIVSRLKYNAILKDYPEAPGYEIDTERVKVPAGWLIEKCGWKGKTVGRVGVHARQALVLVNVGGADGKEAWELALMIQNDVKKTFDIELEPEVNIW